MSEEIPFYLTLEYVKSRYSSLNLTDEQAREVQLYQAASDAGSLQFGLSDWERMDYEWTVFKEILDEAQFREFEKGYNQMLKHHQEGLKESDQQFGWQISYNEEWLKYYEEQILPPIVSKLPDAFAGFQELVNKIDFLKAEYRMVLNDLRADLLMTHFRHSRTFRPNMLKLSLLQIKHYYLWPEYRFFKHKIDNATKAVAEFLETKRDYFFEEFSRLVQLKISELANYNTALYKKYDPHPEVPIMEISSEPDNRTTDSLMGLLLFDKDYYGWTPALLR